MNQNDKKKRWYQWQEKYYVESPIEQEREGTLYFNFITNTFHRLISSHLNGKILEVGCNEGRYTFPLLEKGFNVTGVDISHFALQRLLKKAKERGLERFIQISYGNIEDPSFCHSLGSFNLIYGVHLLHHLYDLDNALRQMVRLLVPGGLFACVEPNPFSPLWYIHVFLVGLRKPKKILVEMKLIRCTRNKIVHLMNQAGLTNIQVFPLLLTPPLIFNHIQVVRKWENFLPRFPIINKFLSVSIYTGVKE